MTGRNSSLLLCSFLCLHRDAWHGIMQPKSRGALLCSTSPAPPGCSCGRYMKMQEYIFLFPLLTEMTAALHCSLSFCHLGDSQAAFLVWNWSCIWWGQLHGEAVPGLGVNSKSRFASASKGQGDSGSLGRRNRKWGSDGGSPSTEQGGTGLEEKAGWWVSPEGGGCRAHRGRKVSDNTVHWGKRSPSPTSRQMGLKVLPVTCCEAGGLSKNHWCKNLQSALSVCTHSPQLMGTNPQAQRRRDKWLNRSDQK